ncbi:MAG: kelch repeat-containing protein [bacterium]|nr:kelch repeat-containing protein [bacterium]
MIYPRYSHTSTLIDTDKLLVIGGGPSTDTSTSAEIIDLTTGESTLLPWRMRVPRAGHTATLLPDGRVLVAGGDTTDRMVEVWNPPSGL